MVMIYCSANRGVKGVIIVMHYTVHEVMLNESCLKLEIIIIKLDTAYIKQLITAHFLEYFQLLYNCYIKPKLDQMTATSQILNS